jgi:hypothetical protein
MTLALFAQALLSVIGRRLSAAPAAPAALVPQQSRQPTRQTGPPQQAVLSSWPSRQTHRGRRGSMTAFRRKRQAQEGRYKRPLTGRTPTPSPS